MARPHVVIVEMILNSPGDMPAFRALIDENAVASARDEPGCLRFDVTVPLGASDRVILYEIYESEAAFAAHLVTPHYHEFQAASASLIASRNIRACALVCEGSKQ